jgi:tetratricopeptide (TPR) repeat protein
VDPLIVDVDDEAWPLTPDSLEDLRWYLEDYLDTPYGVYEDRGAQIQRNLKDWGEAVFAAALGPDWAAFRELTTVDAAPDVVIRSASPALLALPWELMRDPGRPAPVALDLGGMSRAIGPIDLAKSIDVPGGRLRVLMVISRPKGVRDVGYQMIARPLIARLAAVRGDVDLVVLRPSTLDALTETLAGAGRAGEPFQVVHFDGHGMLGGPGQPNGDSVLAFEGRHGGTDYVPASRLARELSAAKVPVVVLNACQSGAIGKSMEAAIATRLLQAGVSSVVAMAYTVYAAAAAEFMAAFYESLFAGTPVSGAVSAGRRQMAAHNRRPSPRGDLPLDDWLVPVHYFLADVRFPGTRRAGTERAEPATREELAPVGEFTGRDALFYTLETAARQQKVIILHGPGGTGKTELAKAFGRWWSDSAGVESPDWVFFHSFESGQAALGLDGVLNEIGPRVLGSDFAQLDASARRPAVEEFLTTHRALLIWDTFETIQSMPDEATRAFGPVDSGEAAIGEFLAAMADSDAGSTILITSRTPESWLAERYPRVRVPGLTRLEANQYASYLLAAHPAAQARRAERAFADLMQWLDGHPLAMRLILPRLDTQSPEDLLDALRGAAPLEAAPDGQEGRTSSLAASIGYSYSHLSEDTRRLLVAISLVQKVADQDVLAHFAEEALVPARFAGTPKAAWRDALNEAASVGLLSPMGNGMYRMHPALPAYLAAQWRAEEPAGYDQVVEAANRALTLSYVGLSKWLHDQIESQYAPGAYWLIEFQLGNLTRLLTFALARQLWDAADKIIIPLELYFEVSGQGSATAAWLFRLRAAVEDPPGAAPDRDTAAWPLWWRLIGMQGKQQRDAGEWAAAEKTFRQMAATLESFPPQPTREQHLSGIYRQLGIVSRARGRLAEARDWHAKSVAAAETAGDKLHLATAYYDAGIQARQESRLDDAEDLLRTAARLAEELGNMTGMAATYHELGLLAEDRGQLEAAMGWYRKSLAVELRLDNKPGLATSYGALARTAWMRDQLDAAEDFYQRALTIDEELGNATSTARIYHQLGIIAQDRGRLDEAEQWYHKAIAVGESIGYDVGIGRVCGQLGVLSVQRGQFPEALEWTVRGVSRVDAFPHPSLRTETQNLVALTTALGLPMLAQTWSRVTGQPLPTSVRQYVQAPDNGS